MLSLLVLCALPLSSQIVPNYQIDLRPDSKLQQSPLMTHDRDSQGESGDQSRTLKRLPNPATFLPREGQANSYLSSGVILNGSLRDARSSHTLALPADWTLPQRESTQSTRDQHPSSAPSSSSATLQESRPEGFHWKPALLESLLMTGFMQGKRLSEEKTRAHLGGPFFKGWWFSISHIDRWADGFPGHEDDVMDEYFNHTVMGSMAGFIQIQNDPRGYDAVFGKSSKYWKSRFKAFWWSAAFSTQWKLGPISEATIGHTKQGYIDYVITPTVGMALLTTEDMLERWVVIPFEKKYSNHAWQAVVRWVCAPTRAAASALSFRTPWHRHGRKLGELIEGNVTGWKP